MKEKLKIFILKVFALSLFLFVLWHWKGESYYISILNYFLQHLYRALGIRIEAFCYPDYNFNNLIPFFSLMIFTKDIKFKTRMSKLAIGLSILIVGHILLSSAVYLLHEDYQTLSPLYYKLSTPLYLSNKILPFLLWVILAKRNFLTLFMPKKVLATK